MKKFTIKNALQVIDTGENADKHLTAFEIEGPEEMTCSDGYHTFDELYEHRITLYIALCKEISKNQFVCPVWRSKLHSDGKGFAGWFILGIYQDNNSQITYHLPNSKWEETSFAVTLEKAPEYDGHTSDDVISRLKKL